MSITEPSQLEVIADYVLNNRLINYLYRSYIDSLGLKGNETVLDFGSGSGAGSRHIAMILSQGNGRLTCLDTSHRWMRIARKRMRSYPNVEYIVGDIRDKVQQECYDIVYIHFY